MFRILVSIYGLFIVFGFQIGCVTSQVNSTVGKWVQIGNDIDGENFNDFSGSSVAMSAAGTTVAIGATSHYAYNDDLGHARVYQYDSSAKQWAQLGQVMDGEAKGDSFGTSLAMSADGTMVAVGGKHNDGQRPGSGRGHVRVLKFNTTSLQWKQIGSDIDGEGGGDQSGSWVTMSADGTVVAIGAPYNDSPSIVGFDSGHVRVYKLNLLTQQWEQLGTDIDGEFDSSIIARAFGFSMSADGTTIAIGSRNSRAYKGLVRAYKYSFSSQRWEQFGGDINGPDVTTLFGSEVAISADGLRIAAFSRMYVDKTGLSGPYYLHMRVFELSATSAVWGQVGVEIIEYMDIDYGLLGHSLDMSADGKTVAIGTMIYNHVRVFTNYGMLWEQVGSNISYGGSLDWVAYSLALSDDGTTVAVGAPRRFAETCKNAGQVRIYKFAATPNVTSTITCDVSWNLYNSITNTLVAPLVNGTVVARPPPRNHTNIEVVAPCAPINGTVITMELYSTNRAGTGRLSLVHSRRERTAKYFLFGNDGSNVLSGRIPSGTYMIRAKVNNGVPSPFTKFTLSVKSFLRN